MQTIHSYTVYAGKDKYIQYVSCLVSTGNFFIDKNFKTVEYGGLKHVVPFGTIPLQGISAPKFLCYPVLHMYIQYRSFLIIFTENPHTKSLFL